MTKRNDLSAKIDAEALKVARIVAAYNGQTLAEYLSEIVLERASRDLDEKQAQGQSSRKSKPQK